MGASQIIESNTDNNIRTPDNMKTTIIFSCLFAMALAAPQFNQFEPVQQFNQFEPVQQFTSFDQRPPIAILRSESAMEGPNFRYAYETEDGTAIEANGSEGFNGGSNIEGSYRFTLPSGEQVEVRYIANENGAQYSSPILPQQVQPIHPIPQHALEQIRFAEQQRAAGVQWDLQGFRINK